MGNRGWGTQKGMHFRVDISLDEYLSTANNVLKILQFENFTAYKDLDKISIAAETDFIVSGSKKLYGTMKELFR